MDREHSTGIGASGAFETIALELKLFTEGHDPMPPRTGGAAAMAVSSSCRTYRRIRPSIELALPEIDAGMPRVAELVRFLTMIADQTCRAR